MVVQYRFFYHSFFQCFGQHHEYLTTFQIGTIQYGIDRGFQWSGMCFMLSFVVEIVDGVAIGQHDTVKPPFASQDIYQQTVAGTTRNTFVTIVGTHHFAYIAFLYQCFEGRQIGFPQIAHGYGGIVGVSQRFWPAMYGIVLGACMCLEIFVVITLHTQYGLYTQYGIQVGVFSASFLAASPTGVTEDVYVRTPESQLRIARVIDNSHRYVEYIMVRTVPIGSCFV